MLNSGYQLVHQMTQPSVVKLNLLNLSMTKEKATKYDIALLNLHLTLACYGPEKV